MNLPKPKPEYDYANEVEARRQIEEADRQTLKRNQDLVIPVGQRVILISPGGYRYALTVSDGGALSTTPA